MPMSPRLLRPRQNIHPEAANWANRVRTNGGTVSGSTLAAVGRFCRAIDAAGIRNRFFRLSLFCGNSDASLFAVRTPLYRGQSLGGTQFGATMDANNNFQDTDYAENNGLLGNTTTKWLNTGFNLNTAGLTLASPGVHMSVVIPAYTHGAGQNAFAIAVIPTTPTPANDNFWINFDAFGGGSPTTRAVGILGGGTAAAQKTIANTNGAAISGGLWIVSRTTATDLKLYNGAGEEASNGTSAASNIPGTDMSIFARWNGSTTFGHWGYRMRGYSVGLGMTAQQVSDFNNAMTTVQTALGRT